MDYDVIVIGSGPGGYTAAIRASQLNLKVAIVEERDLGGTCLNRGCIPTKVMCHAANQMDSFKKSSVFGFEVNYNFNFSKLMDFKNKTVRKLSKGVETLLKSNNVTIYSGKSEFLDKNTIKINEEKLTSKFFIIATGASPVSLNIKGLSNEFVLDSEALLNSEHLPKNIIIIGAGIIGLEFASIFNELGSKVTVVELLEEFMPFIDKDISNILYKSMKNKGIAFYLNSKVDEIKEKTATIISNGEKIEVEFDKILMAVGRKPNYSGLEKLATLFENGKIPVNEKMQTKIDNIYAVGDVVGPYQLAHVASYQGIVAATNIAGINKKASYKAVPSCVYTNPEVVWVGLTESQAKEKNGNVKVGTFPYFILPRAALEGEREGLIKVIADDRYKEILGVEIVGKNATELIHEAVVAIMAEYTVDAFVEIIHAHPTLSEGIKEAAEDLLGFPINKLKNV